MTIPLTKGYVAIVDACDAWIAQWKWCARVDRSGHVYAIRNSPRPEQGMIYLHRVVMGAKPRELVDHKDRNGLNNRRSNLRICSHAENIRNSKKPRHNSSGLKGAHWDKARRKWRAQITAGRTISLGSFSTREEAHAAYVKAARRLHGQFARAA